MKLTRRQTYNEKTKKNDRKDEKDEHTEIFVEQTTPTPTTIAEKLEPTESTATAVRQGPNQVK